MGAIRVYQKSSVVVLRQLSFRHGILLKSAEARETKDSRLSLLPHGLRVAASFRGVI
jgi:hypothetical protein